jgi:hypothetical protein
MSWAKKLLLVPVYSLTLAPWAAQHLFIEALFPLAKTLVIL